MEHVMLDLETMGNKPGCAIVAIGAVQFDPIKGELGNEFYSVVDLASCEKAGLRIEAGTVMWWLAQSDAARNALLADGREEMLQALMRFHQWFGEGNARWLWCHGAGFDEPILAAAYRTYQLTPSWRYSAVRCTRTIYDLAGVTPDRTLGTHHNALDDARNQARAVITAYMRLGLTPAS